MNNSEIKGILIPIGGNVDIGTRDGKEDEYKLDFVSEGILSHVVQQAGGLQAKIVVIPAASSIPEIIAQNYMNAFKSLGCSNICTLHIFDRNDSEKLEALELIKKADGILLTGGNQSKIVSKMLDTSLHRIMREKYRKEPFVIAGTSAGAMCMSHEMIVGGNITESFRKGTVYMGTGMGFITELIIDSHFISRGRFSRLAEAVAKFSNLVGVGLAEDTGLIIRHKKEIQVIGSGMAVVLDARKSNHNCQSVLHRGTPMTVMNMHTHILSNGDLFEISTTKDHDFVN